MHKFKFYIITLLIITACFTALTFALADDNEVGDGQYNGLQ